MSSMSVRHSKVFSLALLAIGRHAKTERKKKILFPAHIQVHQQVRSLTLTLTQLQNQIL